MKELGKNLKCNFCAKFRKKFKNFKACENLKKILKFKKKAYKKFKTLIKSFLNKKTEKLVKNLGKKEKNTKKVSKILKTS